MVVHVLAVMWGRFALRAWTPNTWHIHVYTQRNNSAQHCCKESFGHFKYIINNHTKKNIRSTSRFDLSELLTGSRDSTSALQLLISVKLSSQLQPCQVSQEPVGITDYTGKKTSPLFRCAELPIIICQCFVFWQASLENQNRTPDLQPKVFESRSHVGLNWTKFKSSKLLHGLR